MDDSRSSSDRFQIVRRLGSGASGDVYEAIDREQGARVALKTLRAAHPRAIARFKREFRSLQHLEHPNLISYGELLEDNGQLVITMELVRGSDFVSYVRRTELVALAHADTKIASSGDRDRPVAVVTGGHPAYGGAVDERRLRRGMYGLCRGLTALHAAGKVHRDVKPSNVLVADNGRVVILDLGLLSDSQRDDSWTSNDIVGTPHYMAPEQAAGHPCSPAADWYSVGVVLYQSLTGRLPYDGAPLQVLVDKQHAAPPAPADVGGDVPVDLSDLCMDLLQRRPEDRPDSAEILERLGRSATSSSAVRVQAITTLTGGPVFVGRHRELRALGESLARCTAHEQPVVALVHGESGIGKSALVDVFTQSLDEHVCVLAGRCYERESVSYKAFDGVVSAIARMLVRADPVEAAALLPLHASLLAQVFPVLKRVKAFANAPHQTGSSLAHQELRARVFGALRELLTRLAQRGPVVIAIDDLQWADDDSLALMADLFRPPHAPPLLLVGTVRPTGTTDPDGRRLSRVRSICPDVRDIELAPLSVVEAHELAEALLDVHGASTAVDTETLCADAAGHPLFIDELVRHAAGLGRAMRGAPTLDDALWARVCRLDARARVLLEVLAVASTPIALDTLMHAADVPPEQLSRTVSVLRVSNLVRTSGARASDSIEPYHDRVRHAVMRQLDPERRAQLHRALALALEGSSHPALESVLAFHWRAAGRTELAGGYSARAAARAADALAFDRAARFYRTALELGQPNRHDLLIELGDCLAHAGRGADAADAYETAANETTEEAVAVDLRRRAAEQLLISGHIERGLEAISTVLGALGMRMPRTPRSALLSLVLSRAQLRLRGLRFRERQESEIAAAELMRIDSCVAIGMGLANVDTIRGADFQTRHLLLALRAGEPKRIALALAIEGGFRAAIDPAGRRKGEQLFTAAQELIERTPSAHVAALIEGARCISAFQGGQWATALKYARDGERAIREQRTGAAWQRATIQFFLMYSLHYLGELRELAMRVPQELHHAIERGDLYSATNLRNGLCNTAWLIADDLDEAHRQLDLVRDHWTHSGYHVQHYHHLLARANAHLYAGDADAAYDLVASQWRDLERSLLLRVEAVRIEAWHLQARVILAQWRAAPGDARKYRGRTRRLARRLFRARVGWATGLAHLVLAAAAVLDGREREAIDALARARDAFSEADMPVFAAAASWRLGELLGGDEGHSYTAAADGALRDQMVIAPASLVAMISPGFGRVLASR